MLKCKRLSRIFRSITSFFDAVVKVTGGIAAIMAMCIIFFPKNISMAIEAKIAQIYGTSGWVYYESGSKNKNTTSDGDGTTPDGQLYLLTESVGAAYKDIKVGNKLRAASPVHFRSKGTGKSDVIFVLQTNECIVVVSPPENPFPTVVAKSGGWLKVSTSSCGLFN